MNTFAKKPLDKVRAKTAGGGTTKKVKSANQSADSINELLNEQLIQTQLTPRANKKNKKKLPLGESDGNQDAYTSAELVAIEGQEQSEGHKDGMVLAQSESNMSAAFGSSVTVGEADEGPVWLFGEGVFAGWSGLAPWIGGAVAIGGIAALANSGSSSSATPVAVNTAPAVTVTANTAAIVENSAAAGDLIATATSTDAESNTVTYSLDAATASTGYFAINATSGAVTLTAAGAAFVNEGNSLPAVTVMGTDNGTPNASATGTITPLSTTLVNDAPHTHTNDPRSTYSRLSGCRPNNCQLKSDR